MNNDLAVLLSTVKTKNIIRFKGFYCGKLIKKIVSSDHGLKIGSEYLIKATIDRVHNGSMFITIRESKEII